MIAEDADVIDLLQSNRAHIGVVRVQEYYPSDITVQRLQIEAQMAIYLHQDHPLAQQPRVTEADLKQLRQLRLNTWIERTPYRRARSGWRSPTCCCWKWRSRGLAGASCHAG